MNLSLWQVAIANYTGSAIAQLAICIEGKPFLYFGFNGLQEQLAGTCAQQICQRIGTPCSTFQVNNVNLVHGGVSLWLFDCVVTTNQPDTPPFFKCSNTTFSYNSLGMSILKPAIGDGAMGSRAALEEVYPRPRWQRCPMHKTVNVLNCLPRSAQPVSTPRSLLGPNTVRRDSSF